MKVVESMYEPFHGGDNPLAPNHAKWEEITWARNHALRWAEQQPDITEELADEFAEFFKEGWLDHLKNDAEQIDRDFRKMFDIFRRESGSGSQ